MITRRELLLLRAALLYLEEELIPHGLAALQPYLGEPVDVGWTQNEVEDLRDWLLDCQLRYVPCDRSGNRLDTACLLVSPEEAASGGNADSIVAVVLVPAA